MTARQRNRASSLWGNGAHSFTDLLADDMPWAEWASCAEVGGDVWFPEKGDATRPAKTVCGNCAVRQECLEYAFQHDIRFGVWGGLSERQRRALRRPDGQEDAA